MDSISLWKNLLKVTSVFGCEEVKALCSKYFDLLALGNRPTNSAAFVNQYNDFKYPVQEKINGKLITNLLILLHLPFRKSNLVILPS